MPPDPQWRPHEDGGVRPALPYASAPPVAQLPRPGMPAQPPPPTAVPAPPSPEAVPRPQPAPVELPPPLALPEAVAGPSCGPGGARGLPRPTPDVLADFNQFIEGTIDPQNTLDLVIGRPRLLIFKQSPRRIQMGDEDREPIATHLVLTEKELSLTGRRVGTTVLNLWFTDPKDPTRLKILSYLVRVLPDPDAWLRQETQYKALAEQINHAFPDSYVCLALVGDKVVVSGQAKDIAEATQILRIVETNTAAAAAQAAQAVVPATLNVTSSATTVDLVGTATQAVQQTLPAYAAPGPVAGEFTVINMLHVPGEQQVRLHVVVAEVNRSAARSIGVNFSVRNDHGTLVFANTTGNIAGSTSGGGTGSATGITSVAGSAANLLANFDGGELALAVNALRSLDYARSLAEPNLTTTNGQVAGFQAGGEFPVPVVTGFTAAGLQGVSLVPFGVQLSFVPYVLEKDRIRLVVDADISTRDQATAANVNGTTVPSLTTRNVHTVVELRKGETLAVAGLIQNNFGSDATRVPLFGDVPVVGRLFAFDRTSASEQELVILVTPELVHPLNCDEVPPVPGSDMFEPNDVEFYLWGKLESQRPEDFRSPVRTDLGRMARYYHGNDLYIIGPKGYTEFR